jgi:hypothetical protein
VGKENNEKVITSISSIGKLKDDCTYRLMKDHHYPRI